MSTLPKPNATKSARRPVKRSAATTSAGCFYVICTYNNTKITATNQNGRVVAWSSGGKIGYKNAKKSTTDAAERAAKDLSNRVKAMGMSSIAIKFKGYGPGREGAVRGIVSSGLTVSSLEDITPTAHNGTRKKKQQRN